MMYSPPSVDDPKAKVPTTKLSGLNEDLEGIALMLQSPISGYVPTDEREDDPILGAA
jgi:hypothetical protein